MTLITSPPTNLSISTSPRFTARKQAVSKPTVHFGNHENNFNADNLREPARTWLLFARHIAQSRSTYKYVTSLDMLAGIVSDLSQHSLSTPPYSYITPIVEQKLGLSHAHLSKAATALLKLAQELQANQYNLHFPVSLEESLAEFASRHHKNDSALNADYLNQLLNHLFQQPITYGASGLTAEVGNHLSKILKEELGTAKPDPGTAVMPRTFNATALPELPKRWYNKASALAGRRRYPGNKITHYDLLTAMLLDVAYKYGQPASVAPPHLQEQYQRLFPHLKRMFDVDSLGELQDLAQTMDALNPLMEADYDITRSNQEVIQDLQRAQNQRPLPSITDYANLIASGGMISQGGGHEESVEDLIAYAKGQMAKKHVSQTPTRPAVNPKPTPGTRQFENTLKYARDLKAESLAGNLSEVLFRNEAIGRMLAIIDAPGKRTNILMIAGAGEGKSFVSYGLAQRLEKGPVPEGLKNAQMFELDLGALVAGTQYRGQFEERVKEIIQEIRNYLNASPKDANGIPQNKVVLLIDEIHSIHGAGGGEGATNLLSILKSSGALELKGLTIVSATTPEDWQKSPLRRDNAFIRRFNPLDLVNFTDEQRVSILAHEAMQILKARQVFVPLEVSEYILKEAKRNFETSPLPRASDIQALSASLAKDQHIEIASLLDKIQTKQTRIAALKTQQDMGVKLASRHLRELQELPGELEKLEAEKAALEGNTHDKPQVTTKHVQQAIAILTGQTLGVLSTDEVDRLKNAEGILGKTIIGQEPALSVLKQALGRILTRMRAGSNDKRPISTMLFVGPTGVGKTETAKTIANEFMNGVLIREDMGKYKGEHSSSFLTGSPPGYVGHENGGLFDKIRANPQCVLLLVEIEKADPEVIDVLMSVLEEGEIRDNQGNMVSLKSCILIMTSNLNQQEVGELIAKHRKSAQGGDDRAKEARMLDKAVRKLLHWRPGAKFSFKPEQMGRVDFVVPFNHLTQSNILAIADTMLAKVHQEHQYLKDHNLTISLSKTAQAKFAELVAANSSDEDTDGLDTQSEEKPLFKEEDLVRPFAVKEAGQTNDTTQQPEEKTLMSGARSIRGDFQLMIDSVYETLYEKYPGLENANVIIDGFDPVTDTWELQVKPKEQSGNQATGPAPDTGNTDSKTIAFA